MRGLQGSGPKNGPEYIAWIVREHPIREAKHPIPIGDGEVVPSSIVLEVRTLRVERPAVCLDDHRPRADERIDAVRQFRPPGKARLEIERWDPRICEGGDEEQLEIALSGDVGVGDVLDRFSKSGGTGESASALSIECRPQLLHSHSSSHKAVVDRTPKLRLS